MGPCGPVEEAPCASVWHTDRGITDDAVLSMGSVCEDARLRLQAEELVLWQGLVKIHFSGKSLSAVWRMDWEGLFLSGSRAWVVSALPAVQSLPLALPGAQEWASPCTSFARRPGPPRPEHRRS